MQKIKSIDNNDFNIQFNVLNQCNYSCRYCPAYLNDGSKPTILVQDYINFFKNLFLDNPKIFEYENRFIGFTGGEPTIYEGMDVLIDFFKENNFNITLDTNGSAKMDFWEKNLSKINMTNLSVHPRYANFHHILKVVKLGIEKQSIVKVGILMDPNHWERAMEAVDFFKEQKIPIMEFKGLTFRLSPEETKSLVKATSNDNQKDRHYYNTYSPEQLQWIKNNKYHSNIFLKEMNPNYVTRNAYITYDDYTKEKFLGQEVISKGLNEFFGYQCESGKSNLSIRWNGDVKGSHCSAKANIKFGNLILNKDLRIKLSNNAVLCQHAKCGCVSDMRIKKWIE
jgi:MoaA/NifB/PqqE/SkfB family radical SAM enzyme